MKKRLEAKKGRVSWGFILLLCIPVAVFAYIEKCSGTALTFTLKKYTSDPALIAFIGSINKLFGVLIAPWVAYKSDFLGRGGFIIIGFASAAIFLFLLPNCSSLIMVIGVVVLLQASVDLGYTGPWKPLFFDAVPTVQRGRAMVLGRYLSIAVRFVFMFFLIGQFDSKLTGGGVPVKILKKNVFASLTGEQVIYYLGALGVVVSLVIVFFLFRNDEQPSVRQENQRVTFAGYFRFIFASKRAMLACLLVICYTLMSTRLMTLGPLLITEQFGYSKQIMGNINASTMLTTAIFILPLIMVIIDRIDRFKLFFVCLCLSTLHPILYWVYVKFACPLQIPSELAIIIFNVADSVFDKTAFLVLWPIVFDFTDPKRKGLTNSAVLIAAGLTSFLNINIMGAVVKLYSVCFATNGTYDYMSTYLYIFFAGLIAIAGCIVFARCRNLMEQ